MLSKTGGSGSLGVTFLIVRAGAFLLAPVEGPTSATSSTSSSSSSSSSSRLSVNVVRGRESIGTRTRRYKSSQTFNRYRTIDYPAPYQAEAASEMGPA
ncbi:hypothetical protein BC939DRAFT_230412 [Gamsiella multidivaricata]|uniref:uncharacterized protein n=1 Tax=Gamsiella multidivaricata TaxID=101098 RepID=UPI002220AD6A|nr:uncharacterized protein BC939DRAFT_230412 [Gamsiella multidivaricata]KAI7820512.1 hypothetical protein BC939DRAFT_230412 [Gamsiella multidivaricata]